MDRAVYSSMAELDSRHWWFVARRRVLADLLKREAKLPSDARILEIGCGTGHNFEMLSSIGHVDALEIDDQARAIACRRLGREIGSARLPDLPGVPDRSYDLVALLDVLEHVEDDVASLVTIKQKTASGGRILLTVPANQWMWSAHDVAHHHHRRYSRSGLRDVVTRAGLNIDVMTYFNTLLFPLAVAARVAGGLTGKGVSADKMPPAAMNSTFTAIFGLERHLVGRVTLPMGLSLVALLS